MIERPKPQSFGLVAETIEDLRRDFWAQKERKERIVLWSWASVLLGAIGASMYTGHLGYLVAFMLLGGWIVIGGTLYAAFKYLWRKPEWVSKFEAYDQAIIDFENNWRAIYWDAFWSSLTSDPFCCYRAPHLEEAHSQIGFGTNGHILKSSMLTVDLFFMLQGKRQILHLSESHLFDERESGKALNTVARYHAQVMWVASASGFTKQGLEYLSKHKDCFRVIEGKDAIKCEELVKSSSAASHLQTLKSVALRHAKEVVSAYGSLIEQSPSPFYGPESQLPYGKAEIRECLELILCEPLDAKLRNALECSNVILNHFIPDEEFNKIGKRDDAMLRMFKLYDEGERDAHRLARVIEEADTSETDSFRKQVDERVDKEDKATLKKIGFLRQMAAAEQGDAVSQYNLGLIYETGEGITQDYQEAVRWYRLSAAQGCENAQFNLAVMYANGFGVAQDYQEAFRLYQALAEQGEADAQTKLGLLYAKGQGMTQDYQQAIRWYRLAAEKGDAAAQFLLATMYDYAEGVTQDYQEAVRWYQLAAEQDNSLAMGRLGLMYYAGQGVPMDYVKAYMWFNLAEKSGQKSDVDLRETLAKNMAPEQIAEAQRLAQEWKPTTK